MSWILRSIRILWPNYRWVAHHCQFLKHHSLVYQVGKKSLSKNVQVGSIDTTWLKGYVIDYVWGRSPATVLTATSCNGND
jgi:hypothetical protein